MSRTRHAVSPETARRRRALHAACSTIANAWAQRSGWFGRFGTKRGKEKARAFRAHLELLSDAEWWAAVEDVRPWMPKR